MVLCLATRNTIQAGNTAKRHTRCDILTLSEQHAQSHTIAQKIQYSNRSYGALESNGILSYSKEYDLNGKTCICIHRPTINGVFSTKKQYRATDRSGFHRGTKHGR